MSPPKRPAVLLLNHQIILQPIFLSLFFLPHALARSPRSVNGAAQAFLRENWWLTVFVACASLFIFLLCCFWISDVGALGCFCLHIGQRYSDVDFDFDVEMGAPPMTNAQRQMSGLSSKDIRKEGMKELPRSDSRSGPKRPKEGKKDKKKVDRRKSKFEQVRDKVTNTEVKMRGFSVYNAVSIQKKGIGEMILRGVSGELGGKKWRQIYDAGSGDFYFTNEDTGESVWEAPEEGFVPAAAV